MEVVLVLIVIVMQVVILLIRGVSDDTVVMKILRGDFLQRYLLVRLDSR